MTMMMKRQKKRKEIEKENDRKEAGVRERDDKA